MAENADQSKDRPEPLVGDDVEQLQRRASGSGFTLLPLAHGRGRGVQVMREHRLAEFQRLP